MGAVENATPDPEVIMGMRTLILVLSVLLTANARAAERPATEPPEFGDLPVKEVTVFKDGHAFVLHQGSVNTNEQGDVVLEHLPRAVMGTFWPYANDPAARLTSVVAGRRSVSVERTALSIPEMLEGNVGKRVRIREGEREYDATIVSIPVRSTEELERTGSPGSAPSVPQRGQVVVLKIAEGHRVVPISSILDVTFLDEPASSVTDQERRDLLTLDLDWRGRDPGESAEVGMVYLQRGIRWIPSYRVTLDGEGTATVELQATLINEMVDLENVVANLVIGVPTFEFADTVDPISLQQAAAQLSSHFRPDAQTAYAFSNAIASQVTGRMSELRAPGAGGGEVLDLGPEIAGGAKNEDLFVFTLEHITLRKGERMVLPVTRFELKYSDLYTLDLPLVPPPEMRRQFNNQQQEELARLLHAPKFMHKIRLVNESQAPLTTAPALILANDRLVAQGMMTYTAIGSTSDLTLTKAIDLRIRRTERETKRTPDALRADGDDYWKIDLTGSIDVTNYLGESVDIEVTKHVLGAFDEVNQNGRITTSNAWDAGAQAGMDWPYWWHWRNWPWWWRHLNGLGKVTWKTSLEAGESAELTYSWHYFWR